jgi:hypothetical protein
MSCEVLVPVEVGTRTVSPLVRPDVISVNPSPVTPVVICTVLVVLPSSTWTVFNVPRVVMALVESRSTFDLLEVVIVAVAL